MHPMRALAVLALTVLVALAGPAASPAAARAVTAEEIAVVETRVQAFDAAVRKSDYGTVIAFVPPRVFDTIATENNVEVSKLRDVVAEQMKMIFEGVTLESFDIDVASAERRELPDGRPYLLMPTRTVVAVPSARRVQFDTSTLALEDGGTWYLVRLDDPNQIDVLRRAYPEFANETFPLGASRPLPAN